MNYLINHVWNYTRDLELVYTYQYCDYLSLMHMNGNTFVMGWSKEKFV